MPSDQIQFIVTPFLPSHQPALGISNLISLVRTAGYGASAHYLNVGFGRQIGLKLSRFIENFFSKDLLLGEMIFTPALWGESATPWEEYETVLRELINFVPDLRSYYPGLDLVSDIKRIRENSPAIIDGWADLLLRSQPKILAFTTTFQQNIASIALARRIKEKAGELAPLIIFGGANCEGEMGKAMAENFPFIDSVISGEGEGVILDIIKERELNRAPDKYISVPKIKNMDELPIPDFNDYFKAIEGEPWREKANLVAESSRGCWWGAKSHCTFCGLNGTSMAFRSKTATRFIDELRLLRKLHKRKRFVLSDNILDMAYIKTLLPLLEQDKEGFELYYETKSNLRRDQIETMAKSGIVYIQAGIESLSSDVLRIMGKGTTLLQNLQTLKWCKEVGIGVAWNFLYGFPGEDEQDYKKMGELVPSIVHLPAPVGSGQIRMDRFSPYWQSPGQFGLMNVKQARGYDFIYSELPASERIRLAYFFEFDYSDGKKMKNYFYNAQGAVFRWQHASKSGATLQYERVEDAIVIRDSRSGQTSSISHISDVELELLRAFDTKMSIEKACERVSQKLSVAPENAILDSVERLREENWIVEEKGIFISLVLDFSRRISTKPSSRFL